MKINKKRIIAIAFILIVGVFFISKIRANTNNMVYLSDIDYIKDQSFVESGKSIIMDKNSSRNVIYLMINGQKTPFVKGISAWATSELVYEFASDGYTQFSSWVGVEANQTDTYYNGGVTFIISLSKDGQKWEEKKRTGTMKGWFDAEKVTIDLTGYKYIKLRADRNGNDWWSPWYDDAIYADAKFMKNGYSDPIITLPNYIKTVEDYNEEIKTFDSGNLTEEQKFTILKRNYISKIGYDLLSQYYKMNSEFRETIEWLMTNYNVLSYYMDLNLGSEVNYCESLKVLNRLYKEHKNDFKSTTDKSDLWIRMAISISNSHIGSVAFWAETSRESNKSDALVRYEQLKYLRNENRLFANYFDKLQVNEMKIVTGNAISDDQVEWLNWYAASKEGTDPKSTTLKSQPDYTKPNLDHKSYIWYNSKLNWVYPNKSEQWFGNEEITSKLDSDYKLTDHNVELNEVKLWTVFKEGAVCGGQSKTGSNLNGVYGVPAFVVGQPGHAAFFYQTAKSDNKTKWGLGNNIYGWWKSEYGGTLLGWVKTFRGSRFSGLSGPQDRFYTGSYLLIEQEAIDRIEELRKSKIYVSMAENAETSEEKINYYNKALNELEINIDAWLGLLDVTLNNQNHTDEDLLELGRRASVSLVWNPLPMSDYLKVISNYIDSSTNKLMLDGVRKEALTKASNAKSTDCNQYDVVSQIAKNILTATNVDMATFSLDGDNAGKIIFAKEYQTNNSTRFNYSLTGVHIDDSGKPVIDWKTSDTGIIQLSDEEIASLSEESGIIVSLEGAESNTFSISLTRATAPENLMANDNDDVVVNAIGSMEWSFNGTDWTRFDQQKPDLEGNKKLKVRQGSTGHILYSLDSVELTFTQSTDPIERRYISTTRLSIQEQSTYHNSKMLPENILDGNSQTYWSTTMSRVDGLKYVTIKLDKPTFITALEYLPRQDSNTGRPKEMKVLAVNPDGTKIRTILVESDIPNSKDKRTLEFESPVLVQYLKIQIPESYGEYASLAVVNLYEDRTKDVNRDNPNLDPDPEESIEVIEGELFNPGTVTIKEINNKKYVIADDFVNFTVEDFYLYNTIINPDSGAMPIFDFKDGMGVDEGRFKTGMTIDFLNVYSYEVEYSYTIIVKGDVNGDGFINTIDSLAITKNKNGTIPLQEPYLEAGRIINKSGTPNELDSMAIIRHVQKKYTISQN